MNVTELLEKRHVPYEVVRHEEVFGAQHLAQAIHAPGRQVAKTVLLRADHNFRYIVAVLPASLMVDIDQLKTFLGGADIELATEVEIAEHCPDCEFGVLPPFGAHYGAQTVVDQSLTEDEYIYFECGTHCTAVRIKYADFYAIEHPLVARFARLAN